MSKQYKKTLLLGTRADRHNIQEQEEVRMIVEPTSQYQGMDLPPEAIKNIEESLKAQQGN